MRASFDRGLDAVLYGLGPGWQHVGDDRERLISACHDWLARSRSDEGQPEDRFAESKAIWILDRLLPLDDAGTFHSLRDAGGWREGLYALGRRAPDELAKVAPEEFPNDYFAIQSAWVESRESDEELLDWYSLCRERGWPIERADFDGLAIKEYCRRVPDRDRLIGLIGQVTKRAKRLILAYLIREAASRVERTSDPDENLGARLEAAGDPELARLWREATEERPYDAMPLARELWVAQQTSSDLDALVHAEEEFPYRPTERLAVVCPKDRFDVWEWLLSHSERRGNFPIRRFCEWLEPEYLDLLPVHFRREDREWAACAFHAYVSMLPEGLVAVLEARGDRPLWQAMVMDRHLHAPPELKPPPFVADVQEVNADFRFYDPLNLRSF